MNSIFTIVLVVGFWIALQKWILPKMGIST